MIGIMIVAFVIMGITIGCGGIVVRASASQLVNLGFISQVKSYQKI